MGPKVRESVVTRVRAVCAGLPEVKLVAQASERR
jgi:hypothetical protein